MSSNKYPIYRTGIGQDSHRFSSDQSSKVCIIGGVIFEGAPGLCADSDGDVVFHALCNAITSLTNVPILGGIAIELCKNDGITDSRVYLKRALETIGKQKIQHIAITVEGKRPRMQNKVDEIRKSISDCMGIDMASVGMTVTSGDGLTDFGCGEGLQCFCTISTIEE